MKSHFADRVEAQLRRSPHRSHEPGHRAPLTEVEARKQLRQARADIRRLDTAEDLLERMAGRDYTRSTEHEVIEVPGTTERLDFAVARWDIEARRAITLTPRAATAVLVSRVSASTTTAMTAVLHAATQTGNLDAGEFERIAAALDGAHAAWSTSARHWKAVATGEQQTGRPLVAAAEELITSLRQITQDHAGWAEPELMLARADLPATIQALRTAMVASADHAQLIRDMVNAPLTSRAQTLIRSTMALGVARDLREGHSLTGEITRDELLRNDERPMPRAIRQALGRTATRVAEATVQPASVMRGLGAMEVVRQPAGFSTSALHASSASPPGRTVSRDGGDRPEPPIGTRTPAGASSPSR